MTKSVDRGLVFMRIRHLIYAIILVVIDQLSKYWIRTNIGDLSESHEDIIVWSGVFRITFLKNNGAVWGMGSGETGSVVLLTIATILIMAGVLLVYFRIPNDKKYNLIQIILMFIVAGAIGNLIDRIFLHYVTDFLYFELINFPVFNIADCYITVSCFLLVILMLTKYRNDELDFLSLKKDSTKNK